MRLRTASCLCGPRVRSRQTFFARDAGRSPTRGRADPTGTASIQRRWSRDLDQRWRSIKQMLPRAIEDRMSPVDHIMHSALTGKSDPVLAFQGWLDEALRQLVLGINGAWLLPYVRQATDVGALHARATTTSVGDGSPDQPRDENGKWSADVAVSKLHTLPEVTGSERHFDPSFGGEDYGPEVTVRSAGFERTPESWITKKVSNNPTLGSVPLDKVVINQSAATKGLVEKYIRNPPTEPVDFVEHEGKFYATSGTHRLVAAKMRGAEAIHGRVFQLKGKRVKDADTTPQDRTHILQSLAIAELQGIIEATSQRVVRAFANGYLARKSPSAIATDCRAAVDAVGVQRGRLLAGFMVVRSHAAATLDGFRARGISRVGLVPELVSPVPVIGDAVFPSRKVVRAENKLRAKFGGSDVDVMTAGDDAVCEECQDIADNGPYSLDEAESLIPAHVRCRCTFVSADEDDNVEDIGDAFDPDEPRDDTGKWTSGGEFSRGKDSEARYSAVASYQGHGYKAINTALRGAGKISPKLQDTIKHLDNAVKSSIVKHALTVYRGVSATKTFNPEMFVAGKTVTLKGFTSTTMNSKTAEDFVSGSKKAVRFEIEVPKGAHALEIKSQEGELILPRDAKFKVLGSGASGGNAKQAKAAVEVARAKMTKSPSVANLKAFNKAQDVYIKSKNSGSVVRLKLVTH